jgi:hypothetical protein
MLKELLSSKKFIYLALAFLAIVPFEFLSLTGAHLPYAVEVIAFLAVVILFGRKILTKGIESLLSLRFSNINLLMLVAIAGAFYLGELEEAAIIVILFSLGEFLEDFGIEKSKSALEALVAKTPKTAILKGSSEPVPIESIAIGSIILVRHGGIVPLDGMVEGEEKARASGVDGVMVGRGIFKNPWLFGDKKEIPPRERIETFTHHTERFHAYWGDRKPFDYMKKFAKAYIEGFDGAKEARKKIMDARGYDATKEAIREIAREY